MDKEDALKLVRKYKALVAEEFRNAKVYMFGSYCKGCAHADSDIDVAVVIPGIDGEWLERSSRLWQLTLKVDTLIEPILIDENHPSPLYEDILRTGVAV